MLVYQRVHQIYIKYYLDLGTLLGYHWGLSMAFQ